MEPAKKIIDPAADAMKKEPAKMEMPKADAAKTADKPAENDDDNWGGLPSFLRRK